MHHMQETRTKKTPGCPGVYGSVQCFRLVNGLERVRLQDDGFGAEIGTVIPQPSRQDG